MVEVRGAVPQDAGGIAEIHVLAWKRGYYGQLPQPILDALDPAQRLPRWEATLAQTALPAKGTLVAEDGAALVAFANLRPTRDTNHDPAEVGEVASFYVLPDRWGEGIGRRLSTASLHTLANAGYAKATLWVLDTNIRAIRFYESTGWRADGTVKHDKIAGVPVRELRYEHELAASPT